MSDRKISRNLFSTDPKSKSGEPTRFDQRKDWGYTNQFRRMMQRRREEDSGLTTKG